MLFLFMKGWMIWELWAFWVTLIYFDFNPCNISETVFRSYHTFQRLSES